MISKMSPQQNKEIELYSRQTIITFRIIGYITLMNVLFSTISI